MLAIEFKAVRDDWKFINNSLVGEGGEGINRYHLGFVEESNFITVEIKTTFVMASLYFMMDLPIKLKDDMEKSARFRNFGDIFPTMTKYELKGSSPIKYE